MRIAIASFDHETHTWYPDPTTIEDFERSGVTSGDDMLAKHRRGRSYITGCLKVLDEAEADAVGILDARAPVANRLTEETYEKYAGEIVRGVQAAMPLDGVLLCLHGAMAVDHVPKPEADLTRRVRKVVGDVPIMVTLDLHANEDHELTDACNAVFSIKHYPHVDAVETGEAAARCMVAALRGESEPVAYLVKPGIVSPSVFQGTWTFPMQAVRARADAWELDPKVIYVSVNTGFGYADVPDVGASIIAVTDGDPDLARRVAADVAEYMWQFRKLLANRPLPDPAQAVKRAMALVAAGTRPVVLADHSDRTGDSTHIMKELLRQRARNFGLSSLADPEAVKACLRAGEGAQVTVTVGGWASEYAGDPVKVSGRVVFAGVGDYTPTGPVSSAGTTIVGDAAALDLGDGNYLVLTTYKHQGLDDQAFRAFNVPFESLDIIVLKSRAHFRGYYDNVAAAAIEVDAPGLGPADLSQFEYMQAPADAYPVGRIWRGRT